jgi:hypothetical protein
LLPALIVLASNQPHSFSIAGFVIAVLYFLFAIERFIILLIPVAHFINQNLLLIN